jgi:tetratricopeptide (TPR) repeat protein
MTFALRLQSFQKRLLLLIPAVLLLLGAFFAVRWCFAQAVAEQANVKELAELAVNWSPDNPQAHFALAALSEKTFLPEDAAVALREYERAAAISPHDFRLWLAVGKMRERNGDARGGEAALRRALELAPEYAQIHWTLGNILLRSDRIEEAISELRTAAERNPTFAPYVVDAIMQTFGDRKPDGNLDEVTRRIGESTSMRAALISILAREKRLDDAWRFWNEFTPQQKAAHKADGDELLKYLLDGRRFRAAADLFAQNTSSDTDKPAIGKVLNGDFEGDAISTPGNLRPFAWHVADGAEPQIGFDPASKHGGSRSLVLAFKSVSGQDFRQISQIVAVESNARYRLEFYARTGDLKSNATVRWDIVDANDERILASSTPVPTGNSDWQKFTMDFATSANTQAVRISLARVPCNLPPCSLVGKIWFDDFNMQKAN